jgi:hypothetical protein
MSKVIEHKIAGYPSPGGPVVLVHVLTHDETMNQVAAYVAVLADNGVSRFDLTWISHHGAKLTEAEARKVFDFTLDYRR